MLRTLLNFVRRLAAELIVVVATALVSPWMVLNLLNLGRTLLLRLACVVGGHRWQEEQAFFGLGGVAVCLRCHNVNAGELEEAVFPATTCAVEGDHAHVPYEEEAPCCPE